MTNRLKVTGALTYEDFKKYNELHQRNTYISFFVIASLLTGLLFNQPLSETSLVFRLPMLLFLAVVFATFGTLLLRSLILLRVRNEFKTAKFIKREITYDISDEGITQLTNRSNVTVEWSDILKAHEHPAMFRLYISKNQAHVIPKRFFTSEEDIGVLRTLLKNNLPQEKRKMIL
ncbi:YcxB family protein [Evansella cellulosilytica]|uniref:YcxB-like C-terminal domain-containing protein n=1 Tax=Evansella cellulosilytica (strain ATCC 21833 / DSM 2522 / FERM P-1141 / JCM 9156 / N-4) TaxID=649639 RepID=E6TVM2_EVAC2|nr:YcxB family protein [Evansella cellulosilytica]ADU32150.1 hypothetical protein Bcell_3914 [Evansella cellulosilytica DSM 2522]